jgi:hypothetical protein
MSERNGKHFSLWNSMLREQSNRDETNRFRFSLRQLFLLTLPLAVLAWGVSGTFGTARDRMAGILIAGICLGVPTLSLGLAYGRKGWYQGFVLGGAIGVGYIVLFEIAICLSGTGR